MNRGWMKKDKKSDEYKAGVKEFIKFALQHGEGEDNRIVCPCLECCFGSRFNVVTVRDHLLMFGIDSSYTRWTYHGENEIVGGIPYEFQQFEECEEPEGDTLREMSKKLQEEVQDCPEMFAELIDASKQPLYSGCTMFTKLSATLKLYNIKASNGLSDKCVSEYLSVFKMMLPEDNLLRNRTYAAKKVLSSIGMTYEKIHACPNDCILYRKGYKRDSIPSKVVWYFPIIPRFRRLFGNPDDAANLTWHKDKRVSDGLLRHPADSPQWTEIDERYSVVVR